MNKNFIRKASPNEKFYSDMQKSYTCFSMQFVLEADGDIDEKDFFYAVKEASDYCPFSKAVLIGEEWVNTNNYPKITYLEKFELDDKNFSNDIFLEKIKPNENCVNFYISKPQKSKFILIIKIFHGLMDGKGALIYIDNIFKSLRNEPLERSVSKVTDLSFIKTMTKNRIKRNYELKTELINTGKKTKLSHTYFNRLQLNMVEPFMLPKIIDILSNYYKDRNCNFMIPVDIRRHKKNMIITSNMVLPIFLDTNKNDTLDTITRKLLMLISNNEELNLENADHGSLKNIPFILKKQFINLIKKISSKTNKFIISGVLSDLGKVNLSEFSLDGFVVKSFVSLPVQQPLAPISMVVSSNKNKMDLVFSACSSVLNPSVLNDMLLEIEKVFEEKFQKFDFIKEILNQMKINKNLIVCIEDKNSITYEELDKESDYLATYLTSIGIVKQNTVVLYLSRSIKFIVSIVAILKLQLKYIPMDKSMPHYLKDEILNGNDFQLVLTDCNEILNTNSVIINLNNINTHITKQSHIDRYKDIIKDTTHNNFIAYRIYTSGTTGKSKAVEINRQNLNNYLLFAKNEYSKNEKCNFPLFTSISVDLTVTSVFLPLLTGGCITTFKNNMGNNISKEILEDNEIDCIKMTPSHLKIMCNLNIKGTKKKLVIVGGELFSSSLAKKVKQLFSEDTIIINEYGPTEATVGCMYHIVDNYEGDTVSIGLPIPNTNILMYGDAGVNEKAGELYISGNSVVKEYYKNEEETKSKFLIINENIYYKTGDLVEFVNGKYVCIGRNDRQVKINGHRVELEAIENKINYYKNINSSKIDFLNNILYCMFSSNSKIDISKLKKYCEKNLPSYMQPKEFVQVESFEIGANGKSYSTNENLYIVKNKEIETNEIKNDETITKEKDIKNKTIQIWNEVLQLQLTEDDYKTTFYELGGDSLKLLLLISSTENEFNIKNFESKLFAVCLGSYEELTIKYYFNIILEMLKSIE